MAGENLTLRDRHPLGAWRLSFLAMALGVAIISFTGVWLKDPQTGGGASVLLLLPLAVGYAVRVRQTSRREPAEQERRHHDAEAVLTERQRIARELHDVVAHHMSMIAIQAEAAPYKVETVPDETRRDLAEIRATALLRALAILGVVLGHWLVTALVVDAPGRPAARPGSPCSAAAPRRPRCSSSSPDIRRAWSACRAARSPTSARRPWRRSRSASPRRASRRSCTAP